MYYILGNAESACEGGKPPLHTHVGRVARVEVNVNAVVAAPVLVANGQDEFVTVNQWTVRQLDPDVTE